MKTSISRLAAGAALVGRLAAILVTPGSSCDQQCGNVLDSTSPADVVCDQNNYGSSAGVVFKNCMSCELTSTYHTTNPNSTDQQWLLYNSRYALSECLWGTPGNVSVGDSPCITSRACGPLQGAFEYGNFSTSTDIGAYDYCTGWADSLFVEGCENCLRSSNQEYLANMVVMLQVGCDQRPQPGSTISVDGGIFSTTLMNETLPTATSTWTNINNSGPISLGAKVGIAAGGLCLVLAVTGFCIVCNGRRRRRAFLRKLEMRHKESGWPHPSARGGVPVVHRGPDMNETPLSQKPLRGWDDSPQSATASEPSYARYFSPYSSQLNSPVNGADASAMMMAQQRWPSAFHDDPSLEQQQYLQYQQFQQPQSPGGFPSSSQEKAMQDRHDAAVRAASNPPPHIGVALGGDEPSLRSKVSDQSVPGGGGGGGGGGSGSGSGSDHDERNVEAYELHEVSSSTGGSSAGGSYVGGHSNSFRNRIARENRTPVLQHPGYGRYSPDKVLPPPPPPTHAMKFGLRDDTDGEGRI